MAGLQKPNESTAGALYSRQQTSRQHSVSSPPSPIVAESSSHRNPSRDVSGQSGSLKPRVWIILLIQRVPLWAQKLYRCTCGECSLPQEVLRATAPPSPRVAAAAVICYPPRDN
ncbi:hypothetical protein NE237_026823 [Protea cynaroides]|uniref:Uncharacterized protein n=1 Tax=Protea cynaroides TaxID=273540 RepID=A0A9Q0GN58_9MAGN|nr:hypothetical protein NE237_026823 [Protea cynaroides]